MVDKVIQWRRNYDELMKLSATKPFRWGEHDCVMFAAKALDVQYDLGIVNYTDANLYYDDEAGAVALIEEYGGLEGLVTDVLGVDPLPPGLLTVGDIVLYDYDSTDFPHALAVHDGHQLLIPTQVGLGSLRMERAIKGWRP